MLKRLACASLIAASALTAQPAWTPLMMSGDATRYTYPNSSTPRAGCSACDPEQASGVSAPGAIAWPATPCPDANFCESSLVETGNNLYPPGIPLWWTSLNPDGSHAQDLTGGRLSRPTSVTYRNTGPVRMVGFQVAANISPAGTGTKNIFFNLAANYSGGPEFGFVYDSANRYAPLYFYIATNANCGGAADQGVHSYCIDAPCVASYAPSLGEYQCANPVQDVFGNQYVDSTGGIHQVDGSVASIPLIGAWGRDLVYVAYLYRGPTGAAMFHVEVDKPDGDVFRGMTYEFDPNAMGFGNWYPAKGLLEAATPGYVTITVQPDCQPSTGTAMTVNSAAYLPPAQ